MIRTTRSHETMSLLFSSCSFPSFFFLQRLRDGKSEKRGERDTLGPSARRNLSSWTDERLTSALQILLTTTKASEKAYSVYDYENFSLINISPVCSRFFSLVARIHRCRRNNYIVALLCPRGRQVSEITHFPPSPPAPLPSFALCQTKLFSKRVKISTGF